MQSSTEREALNISVFFLELFHIIGNWNDEAKLKQVNKIFFLIVFENFQQIFFLKIKDIKKYPGIVENFNYEKSKIYILTILQKVMSIIRNFFSKEKSYMQARNTLLLLEKLKNVFPAIQHHGQVILQFLENIKDFQMEDLIKMCEGYERVLKKRMETLPDVNLKELRRVVTENRGTLPVVQTNANKKIESKVNTTIKTTKIEKNETTGFFFFK